MGNANKSKILLSGSSYGKNLSRNLYIYLQLTEGRIFAG